MRPKASVVVSNSATPSTAATMSHTIQDMAAPPIAPAPTVTPPATVRIMRPAGPPVSIDALLPTQGAIRQVPRDTPDCVQLVTISRLGHTGDFYRPTLKG